MKKFINYQIFLVIVISFVIFLFYGAILRHHYIGGKKFPFIQKIAVTFASAPSIAKEIYQRMSLNINAPQKIHKHIDKKKFTKFINVKREGLLILPRYVHSLKRSIVDVIDLDGFKTIHTYAHDIKKMNDQVNNLKEFKRLKIDDNPTRFEYRHPLILEDGSLVASSEYSPLFKIDFCSNLVWINDEERFHHSVEQDLNNNIWASGQMYPYSEFVKKNSYIHNNQFFNDDAIIKLNVNGKILYKKSVLEILIENKLVDFNITYHRELDPIHLNDIQPVLYDGKYWKKDDLFLSLRNISTVIHYRPSTNKVINVLKGPFSQQHDVDIISDSKISIFNNNNFLINNASSNVLTYDFKNKKFTKYYIKDNENYNFKNKTEGLSEILIDGSIMIQEHDQGRMLFFNNNGDLEWEYINKDQNGDIGPINWGRIIENKDFIDKFKNIIKRKVC